MGPTAHLVIAIGGCLAFLVVALLTWIGLRVEALHKRVRPPPPPEVKCERLHASDLAQRWLDGRRGELGVEPLPAEDLPGFRAVKPRVVDEDEVNPRIRPVRSHPKA